MPLSDHEQRLLEQIERGLYADDPKFATTVRHTNLRTLQLRRIRRASAVFVLGFVALLTGLVLQQIWLSVVAFPVMLFAALTGLQALFRLTGRGDVGRSAPSPRVAKSSWVERVEERWRRRWEERS